MGVSAKLPSIVDVLLKHHASPYALSADGKTPIVLAQGELHEVQTLIQQFISNEPAQCVLPGGLDRGALWLGSREAISAICNRPRLYICSIYF